MDVCLASLAPLALGLKGPEAWVDLCTPAVAGQACLVELVVAKLVEVQTCTLACHKLVLAVLVEPVASLAKLVELMALGGTLASCMEAVALVQGRVPSLDS